MPYSIHLLLALATLSTGTDELDASADQRGQADLPDVIAPLADRIRQLAEQFLRQRVTPVEMCRFEEQVQEEVRELARSVVQWTYNELEPAVDNLAKHVRFEASDYTRLNKKTPQNAERVDAVWSDSAVARRLSAD
jgi:hypothetical protein